MKRILSAFLLAAVMAFSMVLPAFAADTNVPTIGTGTETQEATASISKELKMAEGITVPNAAFKFEITSTTEGAPTASIKEITYSNTDQLGNLKKTSPIVFEGAFPHAGVYEYTVKETADTYQGEGTVTYSTEQYLLRVYVANKEGADGGVFIQNITAEKEGTKQGEILFTNAYEKNASLSIEKQTTGALADKTKAFDFTIQFTKPETSNATEFVGTIGDQTVTCKVGEVVKFQLSDGQKLVFKDLPAGTRYVVTEIGVSGDGYTPKVSVVENGTKLQDTEGDEKSDLTPNSNGNLVGEGENKVTFVNTYHEIPITGVILHNLPFILLIVAAIGAFVLLAVLKARRTSRR